MDDFNPTTKLKEVLDLQEAARELLRTEKNTDPLHQNRAALAGAMTAIGTLIGTELALRRVIDSYRRKSDSELKPGR